MSKNEQRQSAFLSLKAAKQVVLTKFPNEQMFLTALDNVTKNYWQDLSIQEDFNVPPNADPRQVLEEALKALEILKILESDPNVIADINSAVIAGTHLINQFVTPTQDFEDVMEM